jgi:hypothetical protein
MLATICGGTDTVLVATNAVWKYLDNGSDQGTNWIAPSFSDATWSSGPAPLGYGRAWIVTTNSFGPNSSNKYITTYYRHRFTVADAATFASLKLRLMRDDGAIVYLNGTQIRRDGMAGGAVDYLTKASQTISGSDESNYFETVRSSGRLLTGTNLLAVEVHQVQTNSSDISFALAVIGSDAPAPVSLLRQPYLQAATLTGICVLAECDSDAALTVQYGVTTNYGSTAQTAFTEITTGGSFVHVVNLTGLQADTLYHYRVQASNTNWPDATFHTLVVPGTNFRFAWMADCRTSNLVHDAIAVAIKDASPLFSLYGGDLCYSAGYSDYTNEFLRPAELALDATVPFYNAPGNHEDWSQNTKSVSGNSFLTCQSAGHHSNHGNVDECFTVIRPLFVVAAQPSPLYQPTKRAFYNPTLRQHRKTTLRGPALDDIEAKLPPRSQPPQPPDQRTRISPIGPHAHQLAETVGQELQEPSRAIAILHAGFRHAHRQHQPQGVHQQMSLAPHQFLARVVTTRSSLIARLDRLTIQNRRGGLAVSATVLTHARAQGVVKRWPQAVTPPAAKPFVDGLPRRKGFGQQTPRSSTAQDVEDGIQDGAPCRGFATAFGAWWQQRFEDAVLGIGQIGWVGL